ncbi:unnamed protein product [Rotaria magnacalcarata]|uniref:Uncharacterized protein n=3 Tax=Rotaria magnacalcarata TaxID=392030 RepID=A0A815EU52_9BILA|nr:unnamed protein product [Rotaria magnacalcarata]
MYISNDSVKEAIYNTHTKSAVGQTQSVQRQDSAAIRIDAAAQNQNNKQVTKEDTDIKEFLENGTNHIMEIIKQCIEDSKELQDHEYKTEFIQLCHVAQIDLYDARLAFISATQKKIKEAKACLENDAEQRKRVHQEWQNILDNTVIQVNMIVRPIKALLETLGEIDKTLERKRWLSLFAGLTSICLGSVVGGILITHLLPAAIVTWTLCAATCAIAPVLPYILGGAAIILLIVGILLVYKSIRTKKTREYLKQAFIKVKVWALTCFRSFTEIFESLNEKMTDEKLKKTTTDALLHCKLDEDVWLSNGRLELSEDIIGKLHDRLTSERSVFIQNYNKESQKETHN